MRIFAVTLVAIVAVLTGCSDPEPYELFMEGLEAGADCPQLFEARNAMHPKDPRHERVSHELRGIGCFFSTSTRRAPPESTMARLRATGQPVETFTMREYRAYRAVIDTPMRVPEDEALRRVAAAHGMTVDEVRAAANKVTLVIFRNGWLGTAESEIRYASDWPGYE